MKGVVHLSSPRLFGFFSSQFFKNLSLDVFTIIFCGDLLTTGLGLAGGAVELNSWFYAFGVFLFFIHIIAGLVIIFVFNRLPNYCSFGLWAFSVFRFVAVVNNVLVLYVLFS